MAKRELTCDLDVGVSLNRVGANRQCHKRAECS